MNITKKIFFTLSIASFALFFSCKNEKTTETSNETTTETTQTENTAVNNSSGEVKLNPAHGQPGHRCEIPVGQPLDGSGSNKSQTISTQTSPVINNNNSPVINTNKATNTGNNTNTGNLNPAHGQPGHRCDIPVGQPLPN